MAQWIRICQCREREFNPWSWKIPHDTKQPSPWATVTELSPGTGEPQRLSLCTAPAEALTHPEPLLRSEKPTQ